MLCRSKKTKTRCSPATTSETASSKEMASGVWFVGSPPSMHTTLSKGGFLKPNTKRAVTVSSVWLENECLDWEATKELAAFLDMPLPTVLFEGIYDKSMMINAFEASTDPAKTGYDIRLKKGFLVFDMGKSFGRFEKV
jgi:hypothetical protein